ncbi:peptidase MA family metallohydrolase [Melioribacteraceae bacterium 4301-Me]|uniref:peptidase MA family metallohydrolase n=1 Tax=Pyranulibacter aquaticus TaxID=3163344 RepID=UPI00359A4134
MKKLIIFFVLMLFVNVCNVVAQFGQNKVQYKNLEWFYIQTKHFDIYFSKGGEKITEFAAAVAESSLTQIENMLNFKITDRISIIIYNSHDDFQETNVSDEYIDPGTGGFTEPFKNRVVFPFEGSYQKFQHVIHHELVHAVMLDMLYGGSIQNIISRGITLQLPQWFMEGIAEYISQGWETNTDMFIRDAISTESLPDIDRLNGYLGYRGGQSVFKYIADTYGQQKIGELVGKIQNLNGLEPGLKASIGIDLKELNERWKKSLKKIYWPEIAVYSDPDEYAKRLTDNKESGGFYNTSPAISPQGDKIAFISDRDIYLNVYLMNSQDGKIIKKVVSSGKTNDFEELNILHPSLSWAPDNQRIALSLKSGGYDAIAVINVETDDYYELPFKMDGIESVSWSHDGTKIAFDAQNSSQSDIYIYDFNTQKVTNITNDIFSDFNPTWTPDGKQIIFSSDRGKYLNGANLPDDFAMHNFNYHNLDLYSIDINTKKITRLTDWELSDEVYPVVSPDGKEIIFVSDYNGISNLYKKSIIPQNDSSSVLANKAIPITNSISPISQPSISYDGKKLTFTALYKLGYNIFILNDPFNIDIGKKELQTTEFMKQLRKGINPLPIVEHSFASAEKKDSATISTNNNTADTLSTHRKRRIFTGQYTAKSSGYQDSSNVDYSKYVFGTTTKEDSIRAKMRKELFKEKLDSDGNYLVNKYKINFSPDLIYANAGYSTLYGLLGTTQLAFSDVLGNHRLIGVTSLQIDIKNSDYGLAYYYLKNRTNWGVELFHTARFVYLNTFFGTNLYRFTNFGGIISASYPFDRFHRIDGSLSVLSVSSENLDNIAVPSDNATYIIPAISYIQDNVLWGYTSPIEGTRYNFTLFGNPGLTNKTQSFFSFVWDYRNYFRFWFDNSFAFRISGGYSGGANPQRFFIGGTENWINRSFATGDIPVRSAADFAFLTPGLPLRGYDYAQQIGTKYSLLNLELRMPLIRYLLTGPIPLFFQNILGVAFVDAGSAWNNTNKLQLFTKDEAGNLITKDLLIGMGVGFRAYLFFLWRFDVAWAFNWHSYTSPRYYLSLGLDF